MRSIEKLEYAFEDMLATSDNPSTVWEELIAKKILTDAWGNWIMDLADWNYKLDLTFREAPNQDLAWKHLKNLIRALNKDAFGNNYTRKVKHSYFSYVAGIETQVRGDYHFHVLVDKPINKVLAKNLWWTWAGILKIQLIEDPSKASRYIAKAIRRDGDIEAWIARREIYLKELPRWWR